MRKPRQLLAGACYHVTVRANRKDLILDLATEKEHYLSVVRRARRKYRFRIHNFCIMGNHVHILIEPMEGESLSDIMRWIQGVFAMDYNRRHGLCGHVWGERFRSRILLGLRQLALAFGYIDENPVRIGLVTNAREWLFGGIGHDRAGCSAIVDRFFPWIPLLFPGHAVLSLP